MMVHSLSMTTQCTGWETRSVLAGAYKAARTLHTHKVGIDANGNEWMVLCGKVQLDSIADHFAGDVDAEPTCPVCAKRWAKMLKTSEGGAS